jgi:hypothetical protein
MGSKIALQKSQQIAIAVTIWNFPVLGGIERHGGTLDAHVVFFHNFVAQKMMSSYVVAMFHHQ